MRLSLKAGERIFVNGAVLRSDRRVTLELLNDATFLLEAHVMQLDDATTPLRQLYFIVQSMLINPAAQQETQASILSLIPHMQATYEDEMIDARLSEVCALIRDERPFEALRLVRGLFARELPAAASSEIMPEAGHVLTGAGEENPVQRSPLRHLAQSRVA